MSRSAIGVGAVFGGDQEEASGEASGDVEQVGVLDGLVGGAEAFDEHVDDGALGFGVGFEDVEEVGAVEGGHFGGFHGGGGGGARFVVEEGHFAEEVAGAVDGEHDFASVEGGDEDFDGAAEDDVHGGAGVVDVEDVGLWWVADGPEALR